MTGHPAERPLATLSLDLDDAWAYLRTRGDDDWAQAPSILDLAVRRLIPLLAELDLRLTVFAVGRDARHPAGREVLAELAGAGHEIASHSFSHRPDLPSLPTDDIRRDVEATAEAICSATGQLPSGFRCPSFGRSPALVDSLLRLGYRYDASVLPTSMSLLLRSYFGRRLRVEQLRGTKQPELFGPADNVLLPLSPFRWASRYGSLLELPVSTLPLLRTPFHMSYLQALGQMSTAVASAYLQLSLAALRARGVPPSFLLHPPDVLDAADAPRLAYLPGMGRSWEDKLAQLHGSLSLLTKGFTVVPLGELASQLATASLPIRTPRGRREHSAAGTGALTRWPVERARRVGVGIGEPSVSP